MKGNSKNWMMKEAMNGPKPATKMDPKKAKRDRMMAMMAKGKGK